jgi:mycofactocin precursor
MTLSTEQSATVTDVFDRHPAPTVPTSTSLRDPLVDEELLVEDVSIDGMCGVY